MRLFHFTLYFLIFTPIKLIAQWNVDTKINTPVALAAKGQTNIHLVTDGNNGAIMAWDDNRNSLTTGSDIYVQRISKSGKPLWAINGITICNADSSQQSVNITESTNGSSIITWEDMRSGNLDIYSQKIDSNGKELWTKNGVVISKKLTNQKKPKIISDNAGGAIIVWQDSSNFYYDIYAQRINSSGVVQWTANGVSICSASNSQINGTLELDGLGGALITWQDKRNNNDYDIYAQHVDSKGVVSWKKDGVAICTSINTQSNPRIEPDGSNGAIIAWADKRNGINYNVYAQLINSSGIVQWTSNGIVVCNSAGNASAIDLKYLGTNGAIVCWKDSRNGFFQIFIQMLNLQGSPLLTANGILISKGIKALNPNVIASSNGAAIVVWQDSSSAGWDIKSQKISKTGVMSNTKGETTICNAADDQINGDNVSDGLGGCIFGWEDHRNGTDNELYAHHLKDIEFAENVGSLPQVGSTKTQCYPNPVNGGNSTITIINEAYRNSQLKIFDSRGQFILSDYTDENGFVQIKLNSIKNGMYFYQIQNMSTNSEFDKIIIDK